MLAQEISNNISEILNDTNYVTYTQPQVIDAINDAQKVVSLFRPDAYSSTSDFLLSSGSKQTLPATARRLVEGGWNTGADGNAIGRAFKFATTMELFSYNQDWLNVIGNDVSVIGYDQELPNEFYVYPSVPTPHHIKIKTINYPIDINVTTDPISINEIYSPCLVSWSVYRLLSRDSDNSPNVARAQEHKQMVFDLLQIKTQSDLAIAAKV